MSEIEALRKKYIDDSDKMSKKSRYGFFSLPPSATAGHTAFFQKKVIRDENGKVKTEERNIFSGTTSSGMLRNSFFKYIPSVFHGDRFQEPAKIQRRQKFEASKKIEGKDIFKCQGITKIPESKASYKYMPEKSRKKQVKDVLNQEGKVKTKDRNIYSSPQTKIETEKKRRMKYISSPFEEHIKVRKREMRKSIEERGEYPFRLGAPMNEYFMTSRETYGNTGRDYIEEGDKNIGGNHFEHETKFKPSCCRKYDIFSYPQYKPNGCRSNEKSQNSQSEKADNFKLVKHPNAYKPSPSILKNRINLLRIMR